MKRTEYERVSVEDREQSPWNVVKGRSSSDEVSDTSKSLLTNFAADGIVFGAAPFYDQTFMNFVVVIFLQIRGALISSPFIDIVQNGAPDKLFQFI